MAQPVKITGVDATIRSLQVRGAKVAQEMEATLRGYAEAVYRRSQVLVPKDTGELARSGRVVWNGKKGFGARFEVSYGGAWSAPYALWVHEDVMAYHAPPTTHHYLSKAVADLRLRNPAAKKLGGHQLLAGIDRVIDGASVGPKGTSPGG